MSHIMIDKWLVVITSLITERQRTIKQTNERRNTSNKDKEGEWKVETMIWSPSSPMTAPPHILSPGWMGGRPDKVRLVFKWKEEVDISATRDLRKWASRGSWLAERKNQAAGKEEKTCCWFSLFSPWKFFKTTCVCGQLPSEVNLWSQQQKQFMQNSKVCSLAATGERHSPKTKLCVTRVTNDHLIGFEEPAYFTVYFIIAFLANISGPVKALISWIWLFGPRFVDFHFFNNCAQWNCCR